MENFGAVIGAGNTDPALGRTDRVALDSYLSNRPTEVVAESAGVEWVRGGVIDTPFVRLPGLISGQCVDNGEAQFLSIRVEADADDARTDQIPGDILVSGIPLRSWGLHLIDVNLVMGDLLKLAKRQADEFETKTH